MNYKNAILLIVVSLFVSLSSHSQEQNLKQANVELTYAKKQGRSKAIPELVVREQTNKTKKADARKGRMIPKNFVGRYKNRVVRSEVQHQSDDVLWQKSIAKSMGDTIDINVNIDGLKGGFFPPRSFRRCR